MQLEILFRGVERSDFLENFIWDNVEPVMNHFLHNDQNSKLKVIVSEERHRTQGRKPSYRCEFLLRPGHHEEAICINKFSEDCHDAIRQCLQAFKLRLRKRSKLDQSWGRARGASISV